MTRINLKKLQKDRKKSQALDVYMKYIEHRVSEDDRKSYLSNFVRIMKLKPETVQNRIQNIVGNLVMKIPEPLAVREYVDSGKEDWVIELVQHAFEQRKYGKKVEDWIEMFKPLVAGYLTYPYILWSIYSFRPDVYEMLDDYDDGSGHAMLWLYRSIKTARDYIGFDREYTISPSMFIKKERR